jgi:hypothetical protein
LRFIVVHFSSPDCDSTNTEGRKAPHVHKPCGAIEKSELGDPLIQFGGIGVAPIGRQMKLENHAKLPTLTAFFGEPAERRGSR